METVPLIIGLATVAVMVAPVVYMHQSQKKQNSKLLSLFLATAEKKNLNVSQHEAWNINYIIGLDSQAGKILFMKKSGDKESSILIDLKEMASCKVGSKFRKSTAGDKIIDKIELVFAPKITQKSEKSIEIYNGEESLTLRGELPLAEKWCGIINNAIRKNKI